MFGGMPDTPDKSAATEHDAETVGPVSAATDRLLATTERLDTAALRGPSLCPGWTRAHVLAHIARNADALTNLLIWASTGEEKPMYPSVEVRNAEIEKGAQHERDELLADLRESAERFSTAIAKVPEDGWERQVRTGPSASGRTIPARRVVWLRFQEVEIHHVDLDAGYTSDDWPTPFVARALGEALRAVGRRDDVPPFTAVVDGEQERIGDGGSVTVHGSRPAMLAWLTGRSSGSDLRAEPAGQLPAIPDGAWL